MIFSINLSPTEWTLLGCVAAFCVIMLLTCWIFTHRVVRLRRKCDLVPVSGARGEAPGVSVVVYCQDEAVALESLLPQILTQDYEGSFEVIVVNEGESSDVRNLIGPLQLAHRNLYLTNTPDGAHNLSRKKLALTLGVKAARYPVVLLTTAEARIRSSRWISAMMQRFADPRVEVVLGFASPEIEEDRPAPGSCAMLDFGITSMTWISAAAAGHPFRGTEYNIAYRKELFFKNKGFSRSLNLHFGDDDIFINEITTRENTVVELSGDALVGFRSFDFNRTLRQSAMRRYFTEGFIRHRHDRLPLVMNASQWLWLGASLWLMLLMPTNWFTLGLVALTFVSVMVVPDIFICSGMRAAGLEPAPWLIPFMLPFRPFRQVLIWLKVRFVKQKRFTWE